MRIRSTLSRTAPFLELAPFIDIALLLSIFLIVAANFASIPPMTIGVQIEPSSFGTEIILKVDKELNIFIENPKMMIDLSSLGQEIQKIIGKSKEASLTVIADPSVPYGFMLKLLAEISPFAPKMQLAYRTLNAPL